MSQLKRFSIWIQNALDARRQAQINRLITRAARRCVRDFKHAIDHIPSNDPNLEMYKEVVSYWQTIFWDTHQYRDQMHAEIRTLEHRVKTLQDQVRSLGGDPEEIPF